MVGGLVSYGLMMVVLVYLLPRVASEAHRGGDLHVTPAQVAVMVGLGLVCLAALVPALVVTLPRVKPAQAAVAVTTSTAVSNTLPEGGAIGTGLSFVMLSSWGYPLRRVTSSYLVTGLWTYLIRYSLVAVALVVLVLTEHVNASVAAAALAAAGLMVAMVGVVVLVLRREGFAQFMAAVLTRLSRPVLRVLRRSAADDLREQVAAFRIETLDLIADRWRRLSAVTLVAQLVACLALGVAVRLQGIGADQVSWPRIVVAYGGVTLAALATPTPGGVGGGELALTALLTQSAPAATSAQVLGAVVLFRIATWLVPIPLGAGGYLVWRLRGSWRRRPRSALAAPTPVRVTADGPSF